MSSSKAHEQWVDDQLHSILGALAIKALALNMTFLELILIWLLIFCSARSLL